MVGDESKLLINLMKRGMDAIKDSNLVILEDSFDPSNLCAEHNYNENIIQFLAKLGW